jgi:membrane-anchored protein YejM (alkaline phosphatase superfamily)
MPRYILDMPLTMEHLLDKLAIQHSTTHSEILRRALNTYATLLSYPEVYVRLPSNTGSTPTNSGSTGLRRIAIP